MEQTLNILSELSLCRCDETLTRRNGEAKGPFSFRVSVHHRGKPGQKLKQIPWGMGLDDFLSCLSYAMQAHGPRRGTAHSRLVPPASIFNEENSPADMPTGQFDGSSTSTDISSSQEHQVGKKVWPPRL